MTKLLIATLALSAACAADRLEFATAKREIVEARLEQISRNVAERRATLAAEFESAGCKAPLLVEQAVKRTKDPNVICTLDGAGNSDIVVGAHYDLATLGTGAVDNWSGASLLPSRYQAMALKP